jgi:hypothetical protein
MPSSSSSGKPLRKVGMANRNRDGVTDEVDRCDDVVGGGWFSEAPTPPMRLADLSLADDDRRMTPMHKARHRHGGGVSLPRFLLALVAAAVELRRTAGVFFMVRSVASNFFSIDDDGSSFDDSSRSRLVVVLCTRVATCRIFVGEKSRTRLPITNQRHGKEPTNQNSR